MELVKTYEEYNELNKEYVKYIQMVMESDISNHDNIIMNNLENYSNLFEDLKLRCDKIEVEEKDINNLRDLNYLALDTLFLTMDLKNFYKLGESERFKMRAVNYINKRKRGQGLSGCPLHEIKKALHCSAIFYLLIILVDCCLAFFIWL